MFTHPDASGNDDALSSLTRPYAAVDAPLADADAADWDGNPFECEEVLIPDHRANVGPAQQVENKLSTLLGGSLLPVSHVRMLATLGNRSHC